MIRSINEINIVSANPNFTIVLPSGCNANCSFCSWRTSKQDKQKFNTEKFLEELTITLENIPSICNQITISGGEPSTFKDLYKVMNILYNHKRKNIKKVVFTTNGTSLEKISKEDWFTNVVDFVNISRHHYDQEANDKIFEIKTIDWQTIKKVSQILGDKGIPINVNCVLSNKISENYDLDFIVKFVDMARKNYINTLTFRKDYDDGFGIHALETTMKTAKNITECPVCRKSRYILKGMEVLFTTSEFEPTDVLGENVYEFILQPNGDLTTDWKGLDKIDILDSINVIKKGKDRSLSSFRAYMSEYTHSKSYGCWS